MNMLHTKFRNLNSERCKRFVHVPRFVQNNCASDCSLDMPRTVRLICLGLFA